MIYQYKCPAGHVTEIDSPITARQPDTVSCEVCGKVAGRHITGGGGTIFKGINWPGKKLSRDRQNQKKFRKNNPKGISR